MKIIGMGYSTEDQHLFNIRNSIYAAMYRRNGLHETADMFWTAWNIYYKKRKRDLTYRIVRL